MKKTNVDCPTLTRKYKSSFWRNKKSEHLQSMIKLCISADNIMGDKGDCCKESTLYSSEFCDNDKKCIDNLTKTTMDMYESAQNKVHKPVKESPDIQSKDTLIEINKLFNKVNTPPLLELKLSGFSLKPSVPSDVLLSQITKQLDAIQNGKLVVSRDLIYLLNYETPSTKGVLFKSLYRGITIHYMFSGFLSSFIRVKGTDVTFVQPHPKTYHDIPSLIREECKKNLLFACLCKHLLDTKTTIDLETKAGTLTEYNTLLNVVKEKIQNATNQEMLNALETLKINMGQTAGIRKKPITKSMKRKSKISRRLKH